MEIKNLNLSAGEEMNFLQQHQTVTPEDNVMNTQEVQEKRLSTCMVCQYVTEDRHCTECGCPVVMMSQFNFKTCPKGYW